MKQLIISFSVALLAASLVTGCMQTNSVMMDQRTAVISTKVHKTGSDWDVLVSSDNASLFKTSLNEAAALTLKHGYRYFELLNTRDQTRMVNFVHGGSANCQGAAMNSVPGAPQQFNCMTSAPSSGTVAEPAMDILVRMYAEGEIDAKREGVFDARWVEQQN